MLNKIFLSTHFETNPLKPNLHELFECLIFCQFCRCTTKQQHGFSCQKISSPNHMANWRAGFVVFVQSKSPLELKTEHLYLSKNFFKTWRFSFVFLNFSYKIVVQVLLLNDPNEFEGGGGLGLHKYGKVPLLFCINKHFFLLIFCGQQTS